MSEKKEIKQKIVLDYSIITNTIFSIIIKELTMDGPVHIHISHKVFKDVADERERLIRFKRDNQQKLDNIENFFMFIRTLSKSQKNGSIDLYNGGVSLDQFVEKKGSRLSIEENTSEDKNEQVFKSLLTFAKNLSSVVKDITIFSADPMLLVLADKKGFKDKLLETKKIAYLGYRDNFSEKQSLLLSKNESFPGLYENEFLVLGGGHFKQYVKGQIKNITFNKLSDDSGINALNNGQRMYLNLLLNNATTVVTATGIAGSGKTLLPLAAAIDALALGKISKIYLARPAVGPNGTGFKPGSSKDKIMDFMRPFLDNLQTLLKLAKNKKRKDLISKLISEVKADQKDLVDPVIEVRPLESIGGVTIEDAWLLCDEFQNSDRELMMLVLGRIGKNAKIVLSGDLIQVVRGIGITTHTNGLTILISQLLDQHLVGHVHLETSERSETAALVGLFE